MHCETAETHQPHDGPGVHHPRWIWASTDSGEPWLLDGHLEDGFLRAARLRTTSGDTATLNTATLRYLCEQTLKRREGPPLLLGKVRAARHGEELDIPIVLPGSRQQPVNRLVIFGDSLSDTGRLKRRLHVFPGAPYWLGRFSNGPAWADYLESSAGLAIQNHSYGGAVAAQHPHIPGEALMARVKEGGQLVVTGSLPLQVDDYLQQNLQGGQLHNSEHTVFLIWAGANDYIWKEPFTGEITTFLNSPRGAAGYERIVNEAVASIGQQIEKLHAAGARQFLVINLPDMGQTPIVLQNRTYFPPRPANSDDERKLVLAERLSTLTRYHNTRLHETVAALQQQLPQSRIVMLDAAKAIDAILHVRGSDYGFALAPHWASLQHGERHGQFQQRCYSGGYLGSDDNTTICAQANRALFWDVIHPTSFAHCWQAYFIQNSMADAGWTQPARSLEQQRQWCESATH